MEKFQNDIDNVTKIVKENLYLLEKRPCACEELIIAAENLNDKSKECSRISKENKWRIWWNNNFQYIQLAFIYISITIYFFY
jgi:hypothetical protein